MLPSLAKLKNKVGEPTDEPIDAQLYRAVLEQVRTLGATTLLEGFLVIKRDLVASATLDAQTRSPNGYFWNVNAKVYDEADFDLYFGHYRPYKAEQPRGFDKRTEMETALTRAFCRGRDSLEPLLFNDNDDPLLTTSVTLRRPWMGTRTVTALTPTRSNSREPWSEHGEDTTPCAHHASLLDRVTWNANGVLPDEGVRIYRRVEETSTRVENGLVSLDLPLFGRAKKTDLPLELSEVSDASVDAFVSAFGSGADVQLAFLPDLSGFDARLDDGWDSLNGPSAYLVRTDVYSLTVTDLQSDAMAARMRALAKFQFRDQQEQEQDQDREFEDALKAFGQGTFYEEPDDDP